MFVALAVLFCQLIPAHQGHAGRKGSLRTREIESSRLPWRNPAVLNSTWEWDRNQQAGRWERPDSWDTSPRRAQSSQTTKTRNLELLDSAIPLSSRRWTAIRPGGGTRRVEVAGCCWNCLCSERMSLVLHYTKIVHTKWSTTRPLSTMDYVRRVKKGPLRYQVFLHGRQSHPTEPSFQIIVAHTESIAFLQTPEVRAWLCACERSTA